MDVVAEIEHAQFFREQPKKSIVLVNGDMMISNIYTLNVCQGQKSLVRDIMSLQTKGHSHAIRMARNAKEEVPLLSPREIEVAVLLCRGCINKEIADRLNVSITSYDPSQDYYGETPCPFAGRYYPLLCSQWHCQHGGVVVAICSFVPCFPSYSGNL